jgi:lipid-A-disaccharide synthase
LVDSPGLHFIFARLARWHGVPVVYYICPQIWAWAPWRRSKILKYTDLLLVILPFEEGMYQNPQVPVVWVGHPLADSLSLAASDAGEKLRSHLQIPPERRVITIFPGSRELEVKKLIPLFREIVDRMDLDPGKHCLLVQSFREAFRPAIEAAMSGCRVPYRVLDEDPRAMAMASDFVFAKSGTTTLEVAYFEKPMMVLYRASALGRLLFYLLSVTPYFALPNVLGAGFRDGKPIVHEQLCRGDEAEKLAPVARSLLEAGPVRDEAIESLRWLKGSAFRPGATSRAADALIAFLERRGWTKPE